MTTSRSTGKRQKVIIVLFIVIIAILAWQIFALFKNDTSAPNISAKPPIPARTTMTNNPTNLTSMAPPPVIQAPLLPKPPILSAQEQELMKFQKQNEEKYVSAVNQLQMLKIKKEIAETNKSISAAKLDTAAAEQKLNSIAHPNTYAQDLANVPTSPSTSTSVTPPVSAPVSNVSNYTVVSISYLQNKWSAVLGIQGKLYQVYVGDVLPETDVKIVAIDKYGVSIKFGEETKKISLVPII